MHFNVILYSYLAAFLAYGTLTLLLGAVWRKRFFGLHVLVASLLTTVWAATIASSTLLDYPNVKAMQLAELARNAAWVFLLLNFIAARMQGTTHFLATGRWKALYVASFGVIATLLFAGPALPAPPGLPDNFYQDAALASWLCMAIFSLLLLEQILRNSTEEERWSTKYLCLGLGLLFIYDFAMYAEALLFRGLDPVLWQTRGFAAALTAPLVAIAIARNTRWKLDIQVSRHVVFHTVTLMASGFYLMMMAFVGYFIRYLGGTWSNVLQLTFLCAAGLLLFALLFSGRIRASTRVWLSKHFFSYKYDYREEWLRFTQILATDSLAIPDRIIQAIAQLVGSPGGLLWVRTEHNSYNLLSQWQMAAPKPGETLGKIAGWMQETEWVIDLPELRQSPDTYQGLDLPPSISNLPRAWLIIPLMTGNQLQGVLLLKESGLPQELNWEDRDLLKLAGRQAASHLAQYQADQALVESRQFEAFNRLSAYVIHDLKNILAQQSLIVTNADKHKHNPAFVDDVIDTVSNSVERMTRLMEQMRSGERGGDKNRVDLNRVVADAVASREGTQPKPSFQSADSKLWTEADPEQLATVFSHIIQNAQEASDREGEVQVRLLHNGSSAVVEIEDNGSGMDEDFILNRLFKAFDSTKGLTGMGIGAFESREFIRSLGGEITVSSTPGTGSLFRVVIPCV